MVPELVGLAAAEAHDRALDARLLAVDQDPSHTPSEPGTVTAQDPAPGDILPAGRHVKIWVGGGPDGGGGGGGGNPKSTEPLPLAPAGAK